MRCLSELKKKVPVGAVNSLLRVDGALLIFSENFFLWRSLRLPLIIQIIAIKEFLLVGEKANA